MMENMGGRIVENRREGNVCARKVCTWTQLNIWEPRSIKVVSVPWHFVSESRWGTTVNVGLSVDGGEEAWQS